jgi:hypothetical protein
MPKPSLNDFLSKASFWPVEEVSMSAWIEHAPFAMWLMDAMRPNAVVELGTHTGYSFFALCQAAKALNLDTELYAIDTWEGDVHAGAYDNSVYESVHDILARDYPEKAHMVRATFADARAQFPDGSVDLVHVDGRHFYEDVKEDVETYLPALSDRGVMILHDIVVHERDFGVYHYWEELKERYDTFGFTHCNGLGVVAVGPNAPAKVRALTQLKDESELAELVRSAYTRLGAAIPTPWIIDNPDVDRALRRLPELEEEVRLAHEDIGRRAGEVANLQARLSSAEGTLRRLGLIGRAARAIPSRLSRGAMSRFGDVAKRASHRIEPGTSPVREIFDDKWYAAKYGLAGDRKSLLADYVQEGAKAGRNPNVLFDGDWYAASNPDLAGMGRLEQAEHFVTTGGAEGRSPHPFFDAAYYLEYNPDVATAGANPLLHYLRSGDSEGRRPNPYFDPSWYRRVLGLKGFAASAYLSAPMPRSAPSEDFDPGWYLATYEDAAESDLDPLIFHLMRGDKRPASPDDSTGRVVLRDRWSALAPYRSVTTSREGNITIVTDLISTDGLYGRVATALILGAQWAAVTGKKLRIVTRRGQPVTKGCFEVWNLAGVEAPKDPEFVSYRENDDSYIDIAADDLWLTTSWSTTAAIRATVDPEKVVYLLMEDERSLYPSGDDALKAWREMTRPVGLTVVDSARLYDALVADGATNLVEHGMSFESSFAAFAELLTVRPWRPRRDLFFDSRPNRARNLFSLGAEALTRSFERGILNASDWTVHCVGQNTPKDLNFGGAWTIVHDALSLSAYTKLVASIDLGLSLTATPHLGYPPLDLVAAGSQVVTNTWRGKTGLDVYGPRLIVTEPTVDALAAALGTADKLSRAGKVDTGSPEVFARTWSEQLSDVVARLAAEHARV